ncbi:hypothetical protein [Dactylosporangium sp. NPDC049140]|uniref:hypothetical protein n=1 Tax=Dactylosporangium sp. NPDC049140 TaxID=3155647 RepID=UPI0033FE4025
MTGLDIIIAALVAGAASGTSAAASTAVGDAYAGLRSALRHRLDGRASAVQLDAEPTADPQVWQARLGADLGASGADRDEAILAAARKVLDLARPAAKYQVDVRDSHGIQIGDGNTMQVGTSYGPAAATMTGPVTVQYGQVPSPPAPPAAE